MNAMKAARTVNCPDCGITHHANTRRCASCYSAARPKCSVADCEKPRKALSPSGDPVCGMHRERLRSSGTHEARLIMGDPDRRFWAKVDKESGSPCWLWTGWINENGYGQFSADGSRWAAHRWVYARYVGPIPEGNEIDHVYANGCRNRHCVNLDHLESVTQLENIRRVPAFRRRNQWTGGGA